MICNVIPASISLSVNTSGSFLLNMNASPQMSGWISFLRPFHKNTDRINVERGANNSTEVTDLGIFHANKVRARAQTHSQSNKRSFSVSLSLLPVYPELFLAAARLRCPLLGSSKQLPPVFTEAGWHIH